MRVDDVMYILIIILKTAFLIMPPFQYYFSGVINLKILKLL